MFTGEKLPGQRAIDEHDVRLGGVLGGGKVAAFGQARLQRLEIVGGDDAERDFVVLSVNGAADDDEAGGEVSVADGQLVRNGGGRHAGERVDAIEYLALEGDRFADRWNTWRAERKNGSVTRLLGTRPGSTWSRR